MKIFLDVGAHNGESLPAALDPKYAFDRVICFEPAFTCYQQLVGKANSRLQVFNFGLWDRTAEVPLYEPGALGASVFPDKITTRREQHEVSHFVKASDWFTDNISVHDRVFLKINCEGCECDLLEDLVRTGEINKVESLLVAFDVRKIPGEQHRESEIRQQLSRNRRLTYVTFDDVSREPTHTRRISIWLDMAGAASEKKVTQSLFAARRVCRLRLPVFLDQIERLCVPELQRALPKKLYVSARQMWRSVRPKPPGRLGQSRYQ